MRYYGVSARLPFQENTHASPQVLTVDVLTKEVPGKMGNYGTHTPPPGGPEVIHRKEAQPDWRQQRTPCL